MTYGARLLLDFLRSKGAGTERGCWWKQSTISKTFGKSTRSVNRWVSELRREKKIKVKLCGSTSATYWLWEDCGNQTTLELPNGVAATPKMACRKKLVSITEAKEPEKKIQPENTTGVALMERTPSEIETLKTQITTFRYRSGAEVELSPDLLTRLIRKADFYRVSLYVLAAHFERARRTVERVPSSAPESSAWFLAVAENALKSSNVGEKRVVELPPPKHKSATDLERAVKLDELSRKPPDCARWNLSDRMLSKHGFDGSIAELARRKKLG